MSEHQRWLLKLRLEQLAALEREVVEVTGEIGRRVADHQELIELLLMIPGVDRIVAWTVLAETGCDMTVFDDRGHLASWAGLCPGNHERGVRDNNVLFSSVQGFWGRLRASYRESYCLFP